MNQRGVTLGEGVGWLIIRHLKMDGWNTSFPFLLGRLGLFSGAILVSGSVVFVRFLCVDVGSQMRMTNE